jgi:arylsulfatase A-like enzyme
MPALIGILLALSTLSGSSEPAPNLVLITFDTTRADHLSVYGYEQPTTPHLEKLASEGVLFEQAYSPVSLTGPSHASIMTGRYPHRHGAVRNGVPLPEGIPTLAEILGRHGYQTAAFLSGWTLKGRLSGLDRGFAHYDERMPNRVSLVTVQRDGRLTTDAALEWLREREPGPFFLWLHLFDPHTPYVLHEGTPITTEGRKQRAYDTEIRHADAQAGRLLAELEEQGLDGSTLVVLAGDHGESLGEEGVWGHSRSVAPEVLAVPLLLRWTGELPSGRSVSDPVNLVDILSTILGLLDIAEVPEHDGLDLSALARGTSPGWPGRRLWFAAYPGVRRGGLKLFQRKRAPIKVGYLENGWRVVWDPKTDEVHVEPAALPAGQAGAGAARAGAAATGPPLPPDAERAREEVVRWIASQHAPAAPDAVIDEDDEERLRSLGYVP